MPRPVFDGLAQDTDRNLTKVLIGEDWTVWRTLICEKGEKEIHY